MATSISEGTRSAGVLEAASPGEPASTFGPLLRRVQEQGLLSPCTSWYVRTIAFSLLAVAAIVTGVVVTGPSWQVLWFAPLLALASARSAFIGHDACHSQITRNRRLSRMIGLVHGNLVLGMSQQWWNDKHNRHHANPNHIDKDPDVAADILVWTQGQAVGRTGLRGWITRYQAWLFFPLTTLEGFALKVAGFGTVLSRTGGRRQQSQSRGARLVEGLTLTLHLGAYLTLLLTSMTPLQALVFVPIHQMLFGLHLGMAFAPNHKGMEMPDGIVGKDWGHLQRQVLTSRNVRGGPVTDWLLGGLNYQVEHHLFPSMPRPRLKRAQPLVREYCARLSIPYTETSAVESYRQALSHMHQVGLPARQRSLTPAP
jgi:fatty acid desaturase